MNQSNVFVGNSLKIGSRCNGQKKEDLRIVALEDDFMYRLMFFDVRDQLKALFLHPTCGWGIFMRNK